MAYIDNVTNILQIQPDGLPTFVRLSQNENGRNLYFQLAGNEIDIPSNATVTISGTKPDGNVYSGTGSVSDNVVLIPEMLQMTAVAGTWDAKVKITSGGNTIATGRVRFVVDADTVDPDAVPSSSELEGLVAEAQQYAETARTEAYGSPLTASAAADMTDHTRVYVYTGSETGYTAGHWYYWDGSAWTDGGIYNSVAVNTDPTLTLTGVAADAKAAGDAIDAAVSDLKSDLIHNLNDFSMWESGAISSSNGTNSTSSTRIRTKKYIPSNTCALVAPDGYKYTLAAYSSGTYVGMWNGSAFVTSATWLTGRMVVNNSLGYDYRIVFAKTSDASISATDASNMLFISATDTTMSKKGFPADSSSVGAEFVDLKTELIQTTTETKDSTKWTDGGYVVSTGAASTTEGRIRLLKTDTPSSKVDRMYTDDGFSFALYGWTGTTYLGAWNGYAFVKTTGTLFKNLKLKDVWTTGADVLSPVMQEDNGTITTASCTKLHFVTDTPKYEPLLDEKVDRGELDLNTCVLEQGGIRTADGVDVSASTRVRSVNFFQGDFTVKCASGFRVYGIANYTSDKAFSSLTSVNADHATVSSGTGYVRLVFSKANTSNDILPQEIKNSFALEDLTNRVSFLEVDKTPSVKFDLDTDLRDVSAYLSEIDYSSDTPVIEQIYSLFDSLVSDYPAYVSKEDAADTLGISYPEYANGIASEGTYHVTPRYRTYMYKLTEENKALGNHNNVPKKKLLIISGIHGDEQAAPFNAYIFSKSLCQGATSDYFRLRSVYDIYIVPCVNGYGMYHSTRVNANGVNINRNYPVRNWAMSGSPFDKDYTGSSAGSEFETQLVCALTNSMDFDVAIDHHNYAAQKWQFYGLVPNNSAMKKLIYQSFVDCCIAFTKGLPSYFGNGYKIFYDNSTIATSPGYVPTTGGEAHRWWYEQGVQFAATVEISDRINYENGEVLTNGTARYSADAFSVNEFTLRNEVLRYCQTALY